MGSCTLTTRMINKLPLRFDQSMTGTAEAGNKRSSPDPNSEMPIDYIARVISGVFENLAINY